MVKKLIFFNCLICLIGIIAEFVFAEHLKPKDNSVHIFLVAWGSLPILTLLLFLLKTPKILFAMNLSLVQTLVVVGVGLILKIDTIYIHPDPQGAIAIVTFPIIQIIVALFIGLFIKLSTKKHLNALRSQSVEDENNDDLD